jgi:hypothetical protein
MKQAANKVFIFEVKKKSTHPLQHNLGERAIASHGMYESFFSHVILN